LPFILIVAHAAAMFSRASGTLWRVLSVEAPRHHVWAVASAASVDPLRAGRSHSNERFPVPTVAVLGAGSSRSMSTRRSMKTLRESSRLYSAFLLDMDGVLHRYGTAVPGAKDFLEYLILEVIPFVVLTNECRYSRDVLQEHIMDIVGVKVPTTNIYTSGNSVRDYFRRAIGKGWVGNVFVIGEDGFRENVERGLSANPNCRVVTLSTCGEDNVPCDFVCVGTVITGGTNDSWVHAERASNFLRKGAKLLYSNPDFYEVTPEGDFKFGCPMPIVNLLTQTTGCSAYNLGKPNPFMLRQAHKQLVDTVLSPLSPSQRVFVHGEVDLEDALFVGDSLDTDMRTAIENDIDAALVLSGTTSWSKLSASALRPTFVFDSIQNLHVAIQEGQLIKGESNYSL